MSIPLSYRRFIRAYLRLRDLPFPEVPWDPEPLEDELSDIRIDFVLYDGAAGGFLSRVVDGVRLRRELLEDCPSDHELRGRLAAIIAQEPKLGPELEPVYRYLDAIAKAAGRAKLVIEEETADG